MAQTMPQGLPDRAALGTMHGKETVIAPPLAALGVSVLCAPIDTDRFGTFSGDVARAGSMLDAARAKARAATEATGLAAGIASEGAYGPHPHLPFLAMGTELLLWLDRRTGQEVTEMTTDSQPVYDSLTVTNADVATGFLARAGFPATAVTVQAAPDAAPLAKGLTDRAAVDAAIAQAIAATGQAIVGTDMRAHMNPRRMSVIAGLAQRLARRLGTPCPACAAPGFGRVRSLSGLPCADCGAPTDGVAAEIFGCTACLHEQARPRAGHADPAHCPLCNP